mmetsp:Transcript_1866/g.4277  ORF Transcript_1866/g.4277 Transcript_1866/m.4277 type:complete len:305 (+) Transcript_1866:208-1122(+)
MQRRSSQYYDDTNGVPLEDGRTHHVGVAKGEVANRVVLVGSSSRAATLCSLLDGAPQFSIKSHRGFETFTGTFQGTPVSIVTTGMGGPMMDFAVRELRHVVDGDLVMVRLGSCGGLSPAAGPGAVVANTPGSVRIARNFDATFEDESDANYVISQRSAAPDAALAQRLAAELARDCDVVEGLNASADSFYDAQGRVDANFRDGNGNVLERLRALGVASVEMESFYLLHLAATASTCARRRARSWRRTGAREMWWRRMPSRPSNLKRGAPSCGPSSRRRLRTCHRRRRLSRRSARLCAPCKLDFA